MRVGTLRHVGQADCKEYRCYDRDLVRLEEKAELEKSMFDSAIGKVYVEEIKTILDPNNGTVIRVEKTRKQIPPNANLQQFLAKNFIPEKYHPLYCEEDIQIGGG